MEETNRNPRGIPVIYKKALIVWNDMKMQKDISLRTMKPYQENNLFERKV